MYRLTVINAAGKEVELTHNPAFTIVNVEGLNPPSANVNLTQLAGMNGSKKNNSSVPSRNIVITIKVNAPVAENRMVLYEYFKVAEESTLYFENDVRSVSIEGIVEAIEGGLFTKDERFQISLLCASPFFKESSYFISEIGKILKYFQFPFSYEGPFEFSSYDEYRVSEIMNTGDADTGVLITLEADGTVSNPVIWNSSTREYFGVTVTMNEGDRLEINTVQGEKYVRLTRKDAVGYTNIINTKTDGSTWLQIRPGLNTFTFTVEVGDDNVNLTFTGYNLYGGV